jgi:hypothetical protein
MEYSAMDEKKADAPLAGAGDAAAGAAAAAGGPAGAEAPLGEFKGFRLDVLAKRRPELRQELLTFRDALMAGEDDEAIKVGGGEDAGAGLDGFPRGPRAAACHGAAALSGAGCLAASAAIVRVGWSRSHAKSRLPKEPGLAVITCLARGP